MKRNKARIWTISLGISALVFLICGLVILGTVTMRINNVELNGFDMGPNYFLESGLVGRMKVYESSVISEYSNVSRIRILKFGAVCTVVFTPILGFFTVISGVAWYLQPPLYSY